MSDHFAAYCTTLRRGIKAAKRRKTLRQFLEEVSLTAPSAEIATLLQELATRHQQWMLELTRPYIERQFARAGEVYTTELEEMLVDIARQASRAGGFSVPSPAPPYPSSLEQLADQYHTALVLAVEYGPSVCSVPPVSATLTQMDAMVRRSDVSLSLRQECWGLLHILYDALLPPQPTVAWTETSYGALRLRLHLLMTYERLYATLRQQRIRCWRNDDARLLTLQAAFPDVPPADFRTWTRQRCAAIAQDLAGRGLGLTGETTRKYLQRARKDLALLGLPSADLLRAAQAAAAGTRSQGSPPPPAP